MNAFKSRILNDLYKAKKRHHKVTIKALLPIAVILVQQEYYKEREVLELIENLITRNCTSISLLIRNEKFRVNNIQNGQEIFKINLYNHYLTEFKFNGKRRVIKFISAKDFNNLNNPVYAYEKDEVAPLIIEIESIRNRWILFFHRFLKECIKFFQAVIKDLYFLNPYFIISSLKKNASLVLKYFHRIFIGFLQRLIPLT